MNDFFDDTEFTFGINQRRKKIPPKQVMQDSDFKATVFTRRKQEVYRRAFSETQLLDVMPREFQDGYCYHILTAGDVDALSYLKVILRQQNIDELLISTWVIAMDDVLQIEQWLESGKLNKIKFNLGEVFPQNYRKVWYKINELVDNRKDTCSLKVFKNHAKLMVGKGDKFHFVIQGSANINTNPRTENATITIDKEAYKFYSAFFEKVKSIVISNDK